MTLARSQALRAAVHPQEQLRLEAALALRQSRSADIAPGESQNTARRIDRAIFMHSAQTIKRAQNAEIVTNGAYSA